MLRHSEPVITTVRVDVSDGTEMILHVAKPASSNATGSGILVLQEAFGVNDWLISVVERFAGLGFVAVAPELYHRSGHGSVLSYDASSEERLPFRKAVTAEGLGLDVRAAYDWLVSGTGGGVDAKRVGAVGFCMGGRTAFLANAHVPLAAAISFYGGNIPQWFDLVARQHGPLLMFWGEKDENITREQRRLVADTLNGAGLVHTQAVFSEAGHGFFRNVRSDAYEPRAAGQAWAMSVEFLRQNGLLPN
jgi:carboxymethylenebutenolidase